MNIVPFSFEANQIRFFVAGDTFEVVASDVVEVLHPEADKRNRSNYLNKVRDKYKGHKKIMTLGGKQEILTLKEAGFYQFIGSSKSPLAEPFQDWLFEEVIPTIRKTGEYKKRQQTENPHGRRTFTETHHISVGQLKVYCLLKDLERWLPATEIAEACGIGKSSASRYCLYLQRAGILDMIEICPGHRYRFSDVAEQRNPATYHRFETAIEAVGNPLHSLTTSSRNIQ